MRSTSVITFHLDLTFTGRQFSTAAILSSRVFVGDVKGGGDILEKQPVIIKEIITIKWTNIFAIFFSRPGADVLRIHDFR
jgi:hypothetical protein